MVMNTPDPSVTLPEAPPKATTLRAPDIPEARMLARGCEAIPEPAPCPIPERGFWRILDALLRNREGFFEAIFEGRNIGQRLRSFLFAAVLLMGFYGLSMGLIGFRKGWDDGLYQMLASSLKVPVLFLLTTAVCFPLLYIVQVLMGARLAFAQTLCLVLMAITVNGVLLAACAPIAWFFTLTGSAYDFLKVLHVVMCAFSGIWAMLSLWYGLRAMCEKSSLYPPTALRILQVWILIFAFVGSQMAWSLRPFVGSPNENFQIFRKQGGNFYASVWNSIKILPSPPENKPAPGTNN